jgi:hypothetical protein
MANTHKYTLLCDDVRQENNGKFLLIGLYMGTVTLPSVPTVLSSLAFFQVYDCERPGNYMFKMRLERMDTGQRLVEGMGMMKVERPGTGVTPVRFSPVPLPAFGTYNFVVELEGEAPVIFTFDVIPQPQLQPQNQQGRF